MVNKSTERKKTMKSINKLINVLLVILLSFSVLTVHVSADEETEISDQQASQSEEVINKEVDITDVTDDVSEELIVKENENQVSLTPEQDETTDDYSSPELIETLETETKTEELTANQTLGNNEDNTEDNNDKTDNSNVAVILSDEGNEGGTLSESTQKILSYIDSPSQLTTVAEINITSGTDLILLSYVDPSAYQNCVLKFVNNQQGFDTSGTLNHNGKVYSFVGLGSESYPFQGTVQFDSLSKDSPITLEHSLFNNLSTKTKFVYISDGVSYPANIKLINGDSLNTALLANKVINGETDANWEITISSPTKGTVTSNPPIIGTIETGCNILLAVDDNSVLYDFDSNPIVAVSKLPVNGTDNVGLICGALNGTLTISSLKINAREVTDDTKKTINVESKNGNAGVLVGIMGTSAALTVSSGISLNFGTIIGNSNAGGIVGSTEAGASITVPDFSVNSIEAKTGNAGGIAGEATDLKISNLPTISNITITGNNAGGLFGSYTYTGMNDALNAVANNIINITINGKSNAGGIFGVLINNSTSTFSINPSSQSSETEAVNVDFGSDSIGNVGGLIGKYWANNLENAVLKIDTGKIKSSLSAKSSTYGGLIGFVGDIDNGMANYIEIGDTEVISTVNNVNSADFGGLIAKLTNSGHMVKITGDVVVNNTLPGYSTCGGLVGYMPSGVLWLVKQPDITSIINSFEKNTTVFDYRGWIVGKRGNTLVVTEHNEWNYNKDHYVNDIGNWGQVLSLKKFDSILTWDGHKVNVKEATKVNNKYSIGSITDFATVAIRMQFNHTGGLMIPIDIPDDSDISLVVTNDIDLSNTGLTSFQRDDKGNVNSANVINKLELIGTKNDDKYKITLPNIKIYVKNDAHRRQGLFSHVKELNVKDLIIDGRIDVTVYGESTFYVGSIAAEVGKEINIENVTAGVTLNSVNGGNNSAVGGLIGNKYFEDAGTDLIIVKDCIWNSEITSAGNNSSIYVGGLIGRVDNDNQQDKKASISFENCTISGTINRTRIFDGTFDDARIGGVLGSCYARNKNYGFSLEINGLNISNATIKSDAKKQTGGLISYEWINVEASIKKVSAQQNNLTAISNFGGLIYKGTGYWSVIATEGDGLTSIPGISIESGSFTGKSLYEEPSSMLVCHAEETDFDNALYLEILDNAYELSNNVTLNIGNSEYFDEIVGTTIGRNGKGNGIVSIATPEDVIDSTNCNTYKKRLDKDYKNSCTRYYYNLDSFGAARSEIPSGDINSSKKMVMYSAYTHCHSGLQNYFYKSPGIIGIKNDENSISTKPRVLDLTKYSYYPAEIFTDVKNAIITFGYKDIELKEEENRKPSDSSKQHYGMHTGLFSEVELNQNDSNDKQIEVNSLTLKGTVGGSAIICGNLQGGNTNAKVILRIYNVKLDGFRIYPDLTSGTNVAPLLINTIGSFATLHMNNVELASSSYDDLTSGQYIASSLIGNVGSEIGSHIQLTFSDMVLNYGENKGMFSRALFLESFQYSGDCSGIYNFTNSEDKRYTLGQELSNTERADEDTGPSGRNNGLQYNFFGDTTTVCSVIGGNGADPKSFFKGYTRYVYQKESGTFHELDINLTRLGLTEGCGTYNDPYIIRSAKQLENLAIVLNSNLEGMEIQVDTGVLNDSTLNSFSSSHAKDIVSNHKKYTCTNSGWFYESEDNTQVDITQKVRLYLRNAYYKIISNDIKLSGEWTGLGATADSAFCGVIDGNGNTISMTSVSGSQFGGLIKFSLGSVIKNLSIDYSNIAMSINCQGIPSTESNVSFFGGVVGWCIGGDTIIDNVRVENLTVPSISGTNTHLAAIGGYVGLVGGAIMSTTNNTLKYGGGVVFRGTISGCMSGDKTLSDSGYFYINPYVGRVLDGYVLSESASVTNTDKNYSIPVISSGIHLTIAENTITVKDNQGLWLLSAIANSGAGSLQNADCYAYNYGKARTGSYQNINDNLSGDDLADERYLGGISNANKTNSYLSRYVNGNIDNLCASSVSIVFETDCNMWDYGNGFRGIGTSYGTNENNSSNYRLLPISSVNGRKTDGSNSVITLAQDRKEYIEEKNNWTSIGSGLFVLLQPNTASFTASNLTLKGTTGITYFESTQKCTEKNLHGTISGALTTGERLSFVGVGMLSGNLANLQTVDNIALDNIVLTGTDEIKLTVNKNGNGSTFAGGIIGLLWNGGAIENVSLENCVYNNISVTGRMSTGGFIGYANSKNLNIEYSNPTYLQNASIESTLVGRYGDNYRGSYGVGGLIGFAGGITNANADQCNMMINSTDSNSRLTLNELKITANCSSDSGDRANVGGLVGLWFEPNNATGKIKNISLEGEITITGGLTTKPNSTVGGLVGTIQPKAQVFDNGDTTRKLEISGIRIATKDKSSFTVKNGRQISGFIGMNVIAGKIKVDDVIIGSDSSSVNITNKKYFSSSQCAAVLFATCLSAKNLEISNTMIINTKLLLDGAGDRGAGIILGYVEKQKANISIQNIVMKNCFVTSNNENMRMGLLVGKFNGSHNINGGNILIQNCGVGIITTKNPNNQYIADTSADLEKYIPSTNNLGINIGGLKPFSMLTGSISEVNSYNSTKIGIIGGDANGTNGTIKLVGLSIQQTENTLPIKYYGTAPSSASYIVRADYTGAANGNASNIITSPVSSVNELVDDKQITSDGASFCASKEAIGTKILNDLKIDGNLNLKHSGVSEASSYLTSKENIWSFSDFESAGGNDFTLPEENNFPVLVLTSTSSREINNIVYSWISVLTNRQMYTGGSPQTVTAGFELSATAYGWSNENNKFQKMDSNPTLNISSNTITLIKNSYDNQNSRFTLLDAKFSDPTGGANDYHLYIPVIVQKVLNFHFWAAAQAGTTYDSATYDLLDSLAIASNGEKITTLLGYEYERTSAEWQIAVDNGDNLFGNFNKKIELDQSLPEGTKLTLVDRNRQNKSYTAVYTPSEGKTTISFSSFKDSSGNSWTPVKLCDMLTLTATLDSDNGQYVLLKSETGATIRTTDGKYYQYVDELSREGKTLYKITVDENIPVPLSERYYLTIQTPTGNTGFYNNLITCPNRLGDVTYSQPTQRNSNVPGKEYTRNGNENRIVFGNCFEQAVSITTGTSSNEISSGNRSISATLTSTIKFTNETAKQLYVDYAKGQKLYQCFELKMKNENSQQVNLVSGIAITATYKLNGENAVTYNYTVDEQTGLFRLNYPSGIGSNVVSNLNVDQALTLTADVVLEFTDSAILNQFPAKIDDESNAGIQLYTTSKLAFKENNLPYSTLSMNDNDAKYFYRRDFKTASLNYNTTGIVNDLGINGREGEHFRITSSASYNVAAVEQASNASKLICKLTLWQRSNSECNNADYTQINADWSSYLNDGLNGLTTKVNYVSKGSSEVNNVIGTGDINNGTYTFVIDLNNGLNKDIPIQIPIDLDILTGNSFEAKNYKYANYKVKMDVELLDSNDAVINGTIASDYIVYTNAKINTNYLKTPSNS